MLDSLGTSESKTGAPARTSYISQVYYERDAFAEDPQVSDGLANKLVCSRVSRVLERVKTPDAKRLRSLLASVRSPAVSVRSARVGDPRKPRQGARSGVLAPPDGARCDVPRLRS